MFFRVRPHVVEGDINIAADLATGIVRDADPARLCYSFQAGRDVNSVTENIIVVDNDIANMDADAEFDPGYRAVRLYFVQPCRAELQRHSVPHLPR